MELQTFNSTQFGELRTAEIEGKIYYCGNDVARALGYARPNDAINQHCRYTVKHSIPHPQNPTKELEMSFIPEGDVYRLTARSKLPQAEKFESWVFDEVLPQINHTGGYRVPQNPMKALQLMFDAQKSIIEDQRETKYQVETLDKRMTFHEEEQELSKRQYDYISGKVSNRLKEVKEGRDWHLNPKQAGELRHGLNGDILRYMGVRFRGSIARKDFEKVCQFIEGWDPSSVTLQKISELEEVE